MRDNVRSGVIGGLISAVIWMIITTALDFGKVPIILGGLLFLVGTGLVTVAISTAISRSHRARTS